MPAARSLASRLESVQISSGSKQPPASRPARSASANTTVLRAACRNSPRHSIVRAPKRRSPRIAAIQWATGSSLARSSLAGCGARVRRSRQRVHRAGAVELEQLFMNRRLRDAGVEANRPALGDAAEPARLVLAEAKADALAERTRQRDARGSMAGDGSEAAVDELDTGGPDGDRAGEREHDLELLRLGVETQEVGGDDRGHSRRDPGVHQHRAARAAGDGSQRSTGGGGQRRGVDQGAAVLEHVPLGEQSGVRDGVDHELMLVQRRRHLLGTIEVDLNLSRLRPANPETHVPARRRERTDRQRAEHASSPDHERAVVLSDFHGVMPPLDCGAERDRMLRPAV